MELNNMPSSKIYREERRYSVPHGPHTPLPLAASEDLHAWSIYRQNLNSDFTDSALGSSDKSPLPYGNFQLRDTTVQSILNHPRYGPKSPLGSNMYTYLKFGLPRVFPPNGSQRSHRVELGRGHVNRGFGDSSGPGAGSSGYDSSDNETTRSRVPPNLRKYRSESDFRVIGEVMESRPNSRAQAIPLSALRDANSRASIAGTRINTHSVVQTGKHYGQRSHSEADLLNSELIYDYNSRLYAGPNRSELQQLSRSQQNLGLAYPIIQVHCLNLTSTLKKVSLQAKAGDLFAIMATSESEGTSLLECLAGLRRRYSGEILINGQSVSQKDLRELCGFVPSAARSTLDPRMSVHSAMNFHAMLRGPIDKSDLNEKIDMLIEDLGLTTVRTTNISKLTHSEKQRLSVACQLLTQASIMILDQATTNMDIFDTFFLVEYLRQWCSGGRIVIMTLQPPTFEILSMCSGVLLLSGGKTTFSGTRADLPRHMGSLGYPCPPFKNPADYYLDLVTLDDLSAAAMLESSARIESLVNAWEQINAISPIAVPPASLPALTVRAECCGQVSALLKRFIVHKQPGSLVSWISKLIIAGFLSLLLGCIFWDVPATDPQLKLNDRLGYHHCMMAVGFWPIIMFAIREAFIDRRHAERDMDVQLYSRSLYICVQCALGLLPNLCIWLAYLLPAYSMSGLYSYTSSSDSGIYFYIGYMLLYLTTIQTIVLLCVHIMPTKCSSTVLFTAILFGLTAVGGFSVHPRNIPSYWKWAQLLSPEKWLYPILVADEYSEDTLSRSVGLQFCRNKQVQHQEIIVQQQCPPPNGSVVLIDFMLQPSDHVLSQNKIEEVTSIALVLTSFILFILTFLIFILNTRKFFKRKN